MNPELDAIITDELDRLYKYVYNHTRDTCRAEDITQNIVLNAYKAFPRLLDKSKILPWLWGIARNTVMQSFKHPAEIPTDEVIIYDIAGISYETPESEYMRKSEIINVRRALSFLAKNYRDVCVMFYLEGKDYNTIAEELGIPLSSVKWRLNRSKIQLREEIEKMDYMESSYRKAIPLTVNVCGMTSRGENFDDVNEALSGLLAQNICLAAYKAPATVTEIASALGVSADYIEFELARLTEKEIVKKVENKYQTMFPIWDKAANDDIYMGNYRIAEEKAPEIYDMLMSLEAEIKGVGFYGSEKDFNSLLIFLIGYICVNTRGNEFESEKLPFKRINTSWFIHATTEKRFNDIGGCGVSSCHDSAVPQASHSEYLAVIDGCDCSASINTNELKFFYELYNGSDKTDEIDMISESIENGKIKKYGDRIRIAVPVLSRSNGEPDRLNAALAPIITMTNELQQSINRRSYETVKKHIPKHIESQADFLGSFCSHCVLECALFRLLLSKGITITPDMLTWFIFK